jgi:hypothetical protein
VKVARWVTAAIVLLSSMGLLTAKAATIYSHTTQALSGQWVMPVIPEHGSLLLVGSAFLALASISRRFKKSPSENTPS